MSGPGRERLVGYDMLINELSYTPPPPHHNEGEEVRFPVIHPPLSPTI